MTYSGATGDAFPLSEIGESLCAFINSKFNVDFNSIVSHYTPGRLHFLCTQDLYHLQV